MMHIQQHVQAYKHYVATLGYVAMSNTRRIKEIENLLQYCMNNGVASLEAISAPLLVQYIQTLKQRLHRFTKQPINIKTVVAQQRIITHYFDYLQKSQHIIQNPASHLEVISYNRTVHRNILTQANIQTLYEQSESLQETCLLSLAYGCGLRLNEIHLINTDDIKLVEKIVIVQKGKGNKRRVIPINQTILQHIHNYQLYERPHVNQPALLLNHKQKRLPKHTIALRLRKLYERSKLPYLGCHILRHSIATHLLQQGVSVEYVRRFLGHAQLETTEIYTHIQHSQMHYLINP